MQEAVEYTQARAVVRGGRRVTRRFVVVGIVAVLCILVLMGGLYVAGQNQTNAVLLRQAVTGEVSFPVYAPKKLPNGFTYSKDEVSFQNGVLSYVLENARTNTNITITIQSIPKDFDISKMTGDNSSAGGTMTSAGTFYNLSVGSSSKYLLDAGDVLIFVSSQQRVEAGIINNLVDSFHRLD